MGFFMGNLGSVSIVAIFVFGMVVLLLSILYVLYRIFSALRLTLKKMTSLEKQISALNGSAVGMGKRIVQLEKLVLLMQKHKKSMSEGDQDYSYLQAQQLISQGIGTNQVAANCGLSLPEVALMELIHGESNKAP